MAHSVSHNLIFELIDDNLIIVTVKKNQFVVDFRFFETLDKDKLETILGELPEIYSEITLKLLLRFPKSQFHFLFVVNI